MTFFDKTQEHQKAESVSNNSIYLFLLYVSMFVCQSCWNFGVIGKVDYKKYGRIINKCKNYGEV